MKWTSRNVAFGLAVVIGLGAFAGSAAELWRIAERAGYGTPPALVAALDGLAVVCVISLSARKDWQSLAGLIAATTLSVGLQVLAVPRDQAPDRYVSAVAVHALVPLASFMAVHLATRLDQPGPPPPAKPTPRSRPVARPAATPALEVGRAAPVDVLDLVPAARKLLAELDLSPHEVGRPRLSKLMRAEGHALGSTKADALLALLREEAP